MKKSNRACVVIAGMHRSGTSALARVLNLIGCDLPKNLFDADEDNQTGYWEPSSINALNNQLLESAGSSWDDCTPCTPGWFSSPRADDFREQCTQQFSEEFGESKLSVFKEPRICRLLPFWLDIIESLDIEPLVILPIRNPIAVSESLAKRDFSDPYYNHHLWLRHVLDAEKGSRGKRRFFSSYDDLVESWSTVISKSEVALQFKWPRLSPKSRDEVDQYIASRYRHHKHSAANVLEDTSLSPWLRETYATMLDWCANGENEADYAKLDEISAAFDQSCSAFARILYRGKQAQSESRALRDTLVLRDEASHNAMLRTNVLEAELASLNQSLAEVTKNHTGTLNQVSELEAALQNAQVDKANAVHDLQIKSTELSRLTPELGATRQQLGKLAEELNFVRANEQRLEARIQQITEDHASKDSHILALRDQLDASLAQIETLTHLQHEMSAERVSDNQDKANLQNQISTLTETIESHLAEITRLTTALQIARADVSTHESQSISLSQELAMVQHERNANNATINGLKAHIELLSTDAEMAASAQSALAEELAATQQERDKGISAISDLQARIELSSSAVAAASAEKSALVQDLAAAHLERDTAISTMSDLQGRIEQLLKDIDTESSERLALTHDLSALKQERDASNEIINGLKAHIVLLLSDAEANTSAYDALSQELSAVHQEQTANQEIINSLNTQIEQLLRDKEASASSQAALTQELSAAQQEHDASNAIISGLKAHISLLMSDVDAAVSAHATTAATLENTELAHTASMTQAKADQEASKQALESLRDQFNTNEQARENLDALVHDLESQLDSIRATLQEREADLMTARLSSQTTTDELADANRQIGELKSAQGKLEAISDGLKQHVNLLMGDVEAQKAELETEKANQSGLWRIVDQVQADLDMAQAEREALETQIKIKDDALSQTQSALRQRQAEIEDVRKELEFANCELTTVQKELEVSQDETAKLRVNLTRQSESAAQTLRTKETELLNQISKSSQKSAKLQSQLTKLIKGLADEKHAYFQRKSAAIQRKAALLVASGVIDVDWYRSVNSDIAASGIDPAVHYLTSGINEGRELQID